MSYSDKKVIFLKSQVDDLTSKLDEYKQKYNQDDLSDASDKESLQEGNTHQVPLLIDKERVTPLLQEYSSLIDDLKTGKSHYEDEVDKITKLTLKLREKSNVTIEEYDENKENTGNDGDKEGDEDGEIYHQESEDTDKSLENQVMDLKELQGMILKSRDRGEMDGRGVDERMKNLLSFISTTSHPTNSILSLFNDYHNLMQNKVSELAEDNATLRSNMTSFLSNLKQEDVVGNLQQVTNNNKQLVERALMERDQSLMKEREAVGEVKRLERVIDELVEGAKTTINNQIEKFESGHLMKVNVLEKKVGVLEKERDDLDSTLREKQREDTVRVVEIEPSRNANKGFGSSLSSQLTLVTREKDDLEEKVKVAEDQLKGILKRHNKEKENMTEEIERLKGRVEEMIKEHGWMEEERKRFMDEYEGVRKEKTNEKRAREDATRVLSKQVLVLQQSLRTKDLEHTTRLESMTDEHAKSLFKLNEMINNKKKTALKLKEETKARMEGLEVRLEELRKDLDMEKRKRMEALNLLQHHQIKTQQAEDKLHRYSRSIEILEASLLDSSNKTHTVNAQIQKHDWVELTTSDHLHELHNIIRQAKAIS